MSNKSEHRFPDAPLQIKALPVDHRGFPVPWFVHWENGKADFRIIGKGKIERAVERDLCWVCGCRMGRLKSFVIGPMCAVNRVSSEPPSHLDCATFSAKMCPFLSQPKMRRNDKGLEGAQSPGGEMIKRNPGVALVWSTLRYKRFADGAGGHLFDVGKPERTAWYAHGREATRAECEDAITSGLPILQGMADQEGDEARAELARLLEAAMTLLPVAA